MLERKTVRRLSEQTRVRLARWRWLRPLLRPAHLWHFARRPVAAGAAIGVFFGLLVPFAQIPAAAVAATTLRANLPAAAIATFITNPLTTAALYYGMYHLGAWILQLGRPMLEPEAGVLTQAGEVGTALLIGVPITAIAASLLTYLAVNVAWIIWVARRRFPLWLRLRRAYQSRRRAGAESTKATTDADASSRPVEAVPVPEGREHG